MLIGIQNFIWRGDNWLLAQKFEQMISIRDRVDQVELVVSPQIRKSGEVRG